MSAGLRRRWILGSVLVALVALVAAACSSSHTTGTIKQGGTLRIGTTEGIDTLNPFVGFSQDDFNAWEQIYPQPVQYNTRTLAFEPDFATSWTTSPDGLTWTFHTQPNAKWSDGQPLTAADAVWTYTTILKFADTSTGSAAGSLQFLTSATAPTPTTLILHYSQPVANVLANLQNTPILPEHVWKKYATGNGAAMKTYANAPTPGHPLVSGGPFICTKFAKGQVALFSRNPNYYGPRPHIDGFGLQAFSNPDAMISALKNKQLDAVENVPVTTVNTVKAAGFHVYTGPSLVSRELIFNSNPKKTTHRELLNPLVREALEYATDRAQIIKTAWLGYGQPGTTLVPPATGKWHDPNIQPLPFDLAKANELLDQAGYRMGPGGVRIADGHPMNYSVIFPTDQNGPSDRAFQIIQADYAKVGVKLTQKTVDPSTAFSLMTAPNNKYLTYDLAMWWWIPVMDPGFILSVTTCDQYGDWSDSGYCNPTYDKLYATFNTLPPAQRLVAAYKLQQMIYDARVYIVFNYNDQIDAWSNSWVGFVESPQGFFTQLSKQTLTQVHQV
jgi:peptide/nickel transport system substrate-binding protein